MNFNVKLKALFGVVALTLIAVNTFADAHTESLVRNGDFQVEENQFPRDWVPRHPELAGRVPHPDIQGKYCLRIKTDKVVGDALVQQKGLALEGGKEYILQYRVKAPYRQAYRVYLETSNPPAGFFTEWKTATGQWQRVRRPFEFKSLKSPPHLVLWLRDPGEILFADVQIIPKPPAPVRKLNEILNGNFERGALGWDLEEGAAQVVSIEGGAGKGFCLELTSGQKGFDPQAAQQGIWVQSGKRYRLSYRVRSGGGSAETTGYQYYRVFTGYDAPVKNGREYGGIGQQDGTDWQDAFEKWQNRSLVFRTPDKNIAGMKMTCQIRGPGKIFLADFVLTPLADAEKKSAISIDVRRPWYRDSIFSTTPIDQIEGVVTVDDLNAGRMEVRLIDAGNNIRFEKKYAPAAAVSFQIPARDLPVGEFSLRAGLYDTQGKLIDESSKVIHKYPPMENEVTFREDRVLLMNGKPWFPIGLWRFDDENALYELCRGGVNTFIGSYDKANLDLAQKYGAKIMAIALNKLPGLNDPENRKAWTPHYLEKYGNMFHHPALVAYFLTDEPAWSGRPVEELLDAYAFHRRMNPYRPVFINEAPRNTIQELAVYARACDVDGVDIYPVPEGGTHSELADKTIACVGKYTDKMRAVVGDRKPIWMTLEGFSWTHLSFPNSPKAVYPTVKELRFMAYDAIIHGATGVLFWGTGSIVKVDFWDDLLKVTGELRDMSAVLVGQTVKQTSVTVDQNDIKFLHKQCAGRDYLIAENVSKQPVEVQFKTGWPALQLTVLFENRNVKLTKGAFADRFGPNGIHIYTTAQTLPPPLVAPPALDPTREGKHYLKNMRKLAEQLPLYTGKANWIWVKGKFRQAGSECYLQKEFVLTEPVRSAHLMMAADDNYTLYFNGRLLPNRGPTLYDLAGQIRPGRNLIAVHAEDGGTAPCGFICDLTITTASGKEVKIISDQSWRTTEQVTGEWFKEPRMKNWFPVEVIGPYGCEPWGPNRIRMEVRKK